MASVLDLGLLQFFNVIFPTLLVFTIVFAILKKTKVFGDEKGGLSAVVAISVAIMTAMFEPAITFINIIAPWFVVFFLFIILMVFAFRVVGYDDDFIQLALKEQTNTGAFFWVTMGVGILIVLGGLGATFGQELLDKTADLQEDGSLDDGEYSEYEQNIFRTIVNPKVVAVGMFFVICIFSVLLLTGGP